MRKKNPAISRFPRMIFVTREHDGETSYLNANEQINSAEDGEPVAVYELRTVHTKRVTHELLEST